MHKLFLSIFVVAITGCAGAPVGYGGSHKVLHKDSDIITISYDSVTESFEDVSAIAETHCAGMGKTAVVSNVQEDTMTMGLVKTYTFSCKGKA